MPSFTFVGEKACTAQTGDELTIASLRAELARTQAELTAARAALVQAEALTVF